MNLSDYFNHHFEIVSADTDDLLEEVLRLRYQVYCVENAFFDQKKCSTLKEQDSYDSHSIHQLIRHKNSGLYVASVRFIMPDPAAAKKKFPVETFFGESFFDGVLPPEIYPHESLAEVSRFLVSTTRERQILEWSSSHHTVSLRTRSIYRRKDGLICYLLLFGLLSAVVRMTTEYKRPYWFVCIEPKLLRLFRRLGIRFIQLGPLVDYHGKRLPCLGSTKSILSGIRQYRPELYHFLTKGSPSMYKRQSRALSRQDSYPLRESA